MVSFLFLQIHRKRLLIVNSTSPPRSRTSPVCYEAEVKLLILASFYNADASISNYDHSDHCRDKDVSLSHKLWLLFRHVRH
jgi:hypothetical protein